jgi:hypothetical protein
MYRADGRSLRAAELSVSDADLKKQYTALHLDLPGCALSASGRPVFDHGEIRIKTLGGPWQGDDGGVTMSCLRVHKLDSLRRPFDLIACEAGANAADGNRAARAPKIAKFFQSSRKIVLVSALTAT